MTNLLSRHALTDLVEDISISRQVAQAGREATLFPHHCWLVLSQTFAGLGKFSTHTKVRERAKVSVFQLLPACFTYFILYGMIWISCLAFLWMLQRMTVFFSARNCLTKMLFMKFCWIQYAKKIDSSALSLEPAFMNTW